MQAPADTFWGTRAVMAKAGVANFTDLVFNAAGTNFVLTFTVRRFETDATHFETATDRFETLSHRMCLLISFRKSSPSQSRQLVVYYY